MFHFEKRTVLTEEIDQGPLQHGFLTRAWLAWSLLLFLGIYWFVHASPTALSVWHIGYLCLSALALARLAALDLTYFLLLNIYTLPLIGAGLLYHFLFTPMPFLQSLSGAFIAGGLGFMVAFIAYRIKGQEAFGMGDVKLMAALGAWVGLADLSLAFSVAFCLNLVLSFFTPRQRPIPFGVGLVVGLWVFVTLREPFMHAILKLFS